MARSPRQPQAPGAPADAVTAPDRGAQPDDAASDSQAVAMLMAGALDLWASLSVEICRACIDGAFVLGASLSRSVAELSRAGMSAGIAQAHAQHAVAVSRLMMAECAKAIDLAAHGFAPPAAVRTGGLPEDIGQSNS